MAHCAYCSGQKMYSEYDGQWKIPHSDPARVQLMEVMLPPNAPREYADPETLWNAVDAAENSCVAQTARKMYITMENMLLQTNDDSEQESETECKSAPDHCFEIKVDNATCCIGMIFKKDARTSLEDRIKRLITHDVLAGNF